MILRDLRIFLSKITHAILISKSLSNGSKQLKIKDLCVVIYSFLSEKFAHRVILATAHKIEVKPLAVLEVYLNFMGSEIDVE